MYLKLFASLLLLMFDWHTQVSASARCRKPNGVEGDVRFKGHYADVGYTEISSQTTPLFKFSVQLEPPADILFVTLL